MPFNEILNKFLVEYNASPIEGVRYEQFNIIEKKEFYYILLDNKVLKGFKTLIEAKEYINTINSGC